MKLVIHIPDDLVLEALISAGKTANVVPREGVMEDRALGVAFEKHVEAHLLGDLDGWFMMGLENDRYYEFMETPVDKSSD